MSAVGTRPETGSATPFDRYDGRDGAVLQHGDSWVTAPAGSSLVPVPAGADQVRRAAVLALTALGGLGGRGVAVGALPYDGSCDAVLRIPQPASEAATGSRRLDEAWQVTELRPDPLPVAYEAAVESALAAIEAGEIEKVVLARRLVVETDAPIDAGIVARRLSTAEPGSVVYLVALPDGVTTLVGASPELLLRREGHSVASDPLAGTARRSGDPGRDREVARQLLATVKEQREHRLASAAVADALSPFCADLHVDAEPSLQATATLWHLRTAIRGTLKPDPPDALTIAAALHPNPAICGTPQAAAASLIERLEGFERRYFAGMVGWVDAHGDGEWSLTLRCAEITGSTAILTAGAGIVAGSDPAAEDLETEAKFGPVLRALGVDPAES